LALYIFSKKKETQDSILKNTSAGGVSINDVAIHFYNGNLPFGGVNNSGIGKSHGEFGFQEFSNAKAVLKQNMPKAGIEMMYPPFTNRVKKMIDLAIKWL
jgi:aldehyde dehydrogenase (NAD+)